MGSNEALTAEAPTTVAGVELGGTKCVCILAAGPDRILAERQIPTSDPETTFRAIVATLTEWQTERGFGAIGVASFGPLELDPQAANYGRLLDTPKPGWAGADVLATFRSLGVRVSIDTDVNGAALAEGRWGAARGLNNFVYVTVGTGVGVAPILEGKAVRGLGHSEAGHMVVPKHAGSPDFGICPAHGGCVEGRASGAAIAARAGLAHVSSLLPSSPIWDDVAHALTGLLHNLVLTVGPQRIIIGGGVALGQPHLLARIRKELESSLAGYALSARLTGQMDSYIVLPNLAERAGPLGAIALGQCVTDHP